VWELARAQDHREKISDATLALGRGAGALQEIVILGSDYATDHDKDIVRSFVL